MSIRVHSWFNTTTLAKTLQDRSRAGKPELHEIRVHSRSFVVQYDNTRKATSGQISGWKARATEIRVHSCSFVVQNHPQRRPCRTDLGLESTSYKNSCPFVSIRGSKRPAAETLQNRSRAGKHELQKFVPIRVHSWFKTTLSEDPAEQISGWKARAAKIRAHSCPFVVQKHPQRRPCRADLGLTPELRRGVLGGRGNSPTTSVGFPPAFAVHSAAASHRGARTVLHSRFCRNPT